MSRFRDFFRGTLRCVLGSTSPERFMNLCKSRHIYLTNIRDLSGKIEFDIRVKDYRKLRPVVRKCHAVPHIYAKKGLPFIIKRNRRHKFFFTGLLLAVLILFLLSRFVWNIEIVGNYKHTDENLISYMKDIGVQTGGLKSKINTARLEEELRLAFEDISWVSARIEGTVLKIEIKEGKVLTPETDENTAGNIVAAGNGTIASIVTRAGTPKVKAGDFVKAGDILIEGCVDIYNDDGTVKTTKAVRGDGEVYADVVYHCNDYYPAYYVKKNFTGSKKYALGLELLGHMFTIGEAAFEGSRYEQISQITKYRLTPNFYLPVCIHMVTASAYDTEIVKYSEDEMKILGENAIGTMLKKLTDDGVMIEENNLRVEVTEDYYLVCGDISMKVSIGTFQPADIIDGDIEQ